MDLLSKIQMKKSSLTKNERKACEAIMNDMLLVQMHSLSDLSKKINVTKTSILRFCQKLGYSGYSEFKYDLINYVNSQNENIPDNETAITAIEKLYTNAINLIHLSVSEDEIKKLCNEIIYAKKVVVCGQMNSYVSAVQLRYALLMYGLDVTAVNSPEELKALDMCLSKEDLVVVYSVSARKDMMDVAMSIHEQDDTKIALITMNKTSTYKKKLSHFIQLPDVGIPNKSLLQNVPLFTIFNIILLNYINEIRE